MADPMAEVTTCPGLFYATSAQDGMLSRIRIPGGILTTPQSEAIATLAEQVGGGSVQITNRANIQIREVEKGIGNEALEQLQALGLASPLAAVDKLRNIMSSPTAGIDRQQQFDTRPLVAEWNRCLISRPDFAVLSAKFSVCFDAGEVASVRDRPNDIGLFATPFAQLAEHSDGLTDRSTASFRLHLSTGDRGAAPQDVGVVFPATASLSVLTALAEVYCDYTLQQNDAAAGDRQSKPRLRDLLNDWGIAAYLQAVERRLAFALTRSQPIEPADSPQFYAHLGIHPQRQTGLFYCGVVVPLGRLNAQQLSDLATLANQHGNGTLRLTPWQNLLIPNIPTSKIVQVQAGIERLGLSSSPTHPFGAIAACSGSTGCKLSATDTQSHAVAIAHHLEQRIQAHAMDGDRPINIHLSGCPKSCAQHHPSDIALLGIASDTAVDSSEVYRVYVGKSDTGFGKELYSKCLIQDLPDLIEKLVGIYKNNRFDLHETFQDFSDRYSITQLKQSLENHIKPQV